MKISPNKIPVKNRLWPIIKCIAVLFIFLAADHHAYGFEIKTRYATITYESKDTLRLFNKKLYMGRLKYLMNSKNNETLEDEVTNKINLIVEKAETILAMYPRNFYFNIIIHPSTVGVQNDFLRLYKKQVNYIAFYSPGQNTVFYSANNGRLRVVSHEIGHVIAENYFAISPPPKIHEVLAQYVETNMTQ